jgi:predicted Fe-S protein YdhL (DUF1289 family)
MSEVISPCVGVCIYVDLVKEDIERICKGCHRTEEEITEWYFADQKRRQEIVDDAKKRIIE